MGAPSTLFLLLAGLHMASAAEHFVPGDGTLASVLSLPGIDGDIITIADGVYALESMLDISVDITIRAENTGGVVLELSLIHI